MAAFVMFARHRGQSGATMRFSGGGERWPARVLRWERGKNSFKHPRAAQIQSIEVRELGVARIG